LRVSRVNVIEMEVFAVFDAVRLQVFLELHGGVHSGETITAAGRWQVPGIRI
jgi:hypothetical protein